MTTAAVATSPTSEATSYLAHGVGTRTDLPISVTLAILGGGIALAVSFAVLGLLWRKPRLRGDAAGGPVPSWLAKSIDGDFASTGARAAVTAVKVLIRLLVLAIVVFVLVVAYFGPQELARNLAPWAFYVTFWVGLLLSALIGPFWAWINPLRTLHSGVRLIAGEAPAAHLLPKLGYWPAAVGLTAFVWLELAAPNRSVPLNVGLFIVSYAVIQLMAGAIFGAGWYAQGDAFEVLSRLFGRMAPFGRRDDGVLVWRSPFNGLDGQPKLPGLQAIVIILIGSTAFDGLTRTLWWSEGIGAGGEGAWLTNTLGLVACFAMTAGLYIIGTELSGMLGRYDDASVEYAHTLVPIAFGYAVAHYFSLFVYDGQNTWVLASDPFNTGLDLLGTARQSIDYSVVSARVISLVQVGAVVLGHVFAAVLAHDRAVAIAARKPGSGHPVLSQLPMLTVMVVFTLTALSLLLGEVPW